ncbi:hypothetical protein [Rhizobium halophytocola]|uniref:Uncharacterized protein n=1 Tax=Rhizobium halophytocola TaxID=735519 RepID=A0ABS4E5U5_9HYPH|nr:hypothetical protein [Rhizobium halophytocola]MBP1853320.1 hypothetical protein [Rhizobium halophytocola]
MAGRTRYIRLLLALAMLVIGGVLLYGQFTGRPTPAVDSSIDPAVQIAAIEKASGTRILTGDPDTMTVGGSDRSVASQLPGVTLAPAETAGLGPTLTGIGLSLSVYPPGTFAGLCPGIVLASRIGFGDAEGGGTDGPNFIVIASNPAFGDDTNLRTARLGVHHEFSSLIWQRQPTIAMRWGMLMPPGWQADATAAEAIGKAGDDDPAPDTGILSAYGATSTENDFNTYAEIALGDPERMHALAAATPVVATKLALLIEAYLATDPGFRPMFETLGYTPQD